MLDNIARILLPLTLLCAGPVAGQGDRPSCTMLKSLDLKPLLGVDHDAPVPFGKEACRAETKTPARMIILTTFEGPIEDLRRRFGNVRKMNENELKDQAIVVNEPALGPDGFSVRERGETRAIEVYSIKGTRALVFIGVRAVGAPFDDAGVKQYIDMARSTLDKLP